jgi:hypothetical protein
MRTHLISLTLALLATSAFAENKEITVDADGKPAFKMSIPKAAEVATKGEKTTIQTPDLRVYLWHVPSAKSVADVVSHIGDVIKGEFVQYVVQSNDPIKLAGHEARHLKGKGEEADDNDPGTADVVIFTDGKAVFVACVHGERDEAAKERPDFLKALESIEVP